MRGAGRFFSREKQDFAQVQEPTKYWSSGIAHMKNSFGIRKAACMYQFITNNHASFHLWLNQNFPKYQKVSKYHQHNYSLEKEPEKSFYLSIFQKYLFLGT